MKIYPKYKDSGIQWLGQIPEHWETSLLFQVTYEHFLSNKEVHHQNLLSLSYGNIVRKDINTTGGLLPASFDTYQIVEEGNIVMRLTDLQNDHKSLRVGLVKEEGIVTSAYVCLGISNEETIKPSYLYRLLHTYDIWKLFYSMGGGIRQGLNWQGLRKLQVIVPPLNEQEKIVEYIDSKTQKIDAYVAEREREVQALTELKQSQIAEVVTRGLNPDAPLKDSGVPWIGMIPEHWDVKRFGAICQLKSICNCENEELLSVYLDRGVIRFSEDESKRTNPTSKDLTNYQLVEYGDFVLNNQQAWRGSVGVSKYRGIVSPAYFIFKLSPELDTDFANYLFRSKNYVAYYHICSKGVGSIQRNLEWGKLKQKMVFIPPIGEQKAIVEYINTKCNHIDTMIANIESEIAYLKEYKQRLIADAVTGAINVQ